MKIVLYPFIALSALGLVLSLATNIAAILGLHVPKEVTLLIPGILIVWLPTAIAAGITTKGFYRKDFWKVALRGAPKWMEIMIYGFVIYASINFIFITPLAANNSQNPDSATTISFSGLILPFYSAALAILYSASQIKQVGFFHKCPNGHQVAFSETYCKICGQPISDDVK